MSVRVAVGVHGDVRNLGGIDVARREDAVDLALARGRGDMESGIAGQREFDCGRREVASDIGGVGIAHHAVQQRAGGLLGVGVGMVGARQRPLQFGGFDVSAASSCLRTRSALASMSRPVSTNVMALRNPPMLFSDTFSVGGGGSPHAADPHPVEPSSDSRMVSTRSVTSGWRSARR